jgi:hypothetical protein
VKYPLDVVGSLTAREPDQMTERTLEPFGRFGIRTVPRPIPRKRGVVNFGAELHQQGPPVCRSSTHPALKKGIKSPRGDLLERVAGWYPQLPLPFFSVAQHQPDERDATPRPYRLGSASGEHTVRAMVPVV